MANKDEIQTFSLNIESIVKEKAMPYMDAVIFYCDQVGLEVEVASKLISGNLKAKIKLEAEALHFLPKSNTTKLPL